MSAGKLTLYAMFIKCFGLGLVWVRSCVYERPNV